VRGANSRGEASAAGKEGKRETEDRRNRGQGEERGVVVSSNVEEVKKIEATVRVRRHYVSR